MREIHLSDEVVFRGGRKPWEDDQTLLIGSSSGAGHQTSGVRVRTWLIGVLGFLLASLIVINSLITGQFRVTHFVNATAIRNNLVPGHAHLVNQKITGYLVRNKGCRIAALDPHDSVSRRYMHAEKPIECEFGNQSPLIESNDTAIFVNTEAINQYYNNSEVPDCCWRAVIRKEDQDNAVSYGDECSRFTNSATVSSEFVKVECFQDGKQIYRDYHAFVPRKNETEKRCREAGGTFDPDRLSLLVVGLDSISRLNFHRMMPKTVKSLKNLEAIELLGYNKVGDNTYPNLVPVLSGLSVDELQKGCWRDTKKPFDDCPFMWKNFSKSGYRTIFAEDACAMTTFNYLKPGFRNQPTDYYLRPYCIAAEGDIGNTHKLNSNLCLGTRKNFVNLLNYTMKVAKTFANDRYFGFFWQASLTHDFFNYPQLGDDPYSEFFDYLKVNDHLLNNTALVVMSDHGMRWGEFRQTYQGRMEGSLPFIFLVFPEWWKAKYSLAVANLRRNTASLTTPFDLHETLFDMTNPRNIREESIRKRSKILNEGNISRGISWFLSIPDHRTCSMAGIPEHWCMCHTSNNVTIADPAVKNATRFIVNEINRLVKNYPQCSALTLNRVMDAKMWSGNDEERKDKSAPWADYTVTLQTEPGGAIFEGSVRHRRNDTSNKLVGSISRLNAYGTQSACVDDFNMRLYCYCH